MIAQFKTVATALLLSVALGAPAYAGPFIIDGTDADDHGFASGGVNQEGWFYIQRGLENIAVAPSLTRTQKTIAVLGSDPGSQAANAVNSGVSLSPTLSAAGWNVVLLNDTQISDFFTDAAGATLKSTQASVLYMDSSFNVGGGLNGAEQAIIDSFATEINNFVGSGGGLFSHSQGYGWLSTLVPGLTTACCGDSGITLTPAGNANFPGLTNSDLSSGPYHNTFPNAGGLPILGVGSPGTFLAGEAVILGGAGGSITDPDPVSPIPEPASWLMMISGFGLVGGALRRRRTMETAIA